MKPLLSMKTLLRTPFKTMLTFLIIVAASFALFSKVSEYAVTTREMRHATSYYRGVGALDTGVPITAGKNEYSQIHENEILAPPAITAEQIEAFSSLPQVTSTDIRYMTTGISDSYYRIDMPGDSTYNYTARFVLEGTFSKYSDAPYSNGTILNLEFTDCKLLAGHPSVLPGSGSNALIKIHAEDGETIYTTVASAGMGIRVYHVIYDNPYGMSFVNTLEEGSRYLLIGRWEPRVSGNLKLGDQDTMDYCDSFWLLDGKPENYLETEEFSKVRELIEITNSDLKAFDIIYTQDMLSIPRFAEEKMAITQGRALNREDIGSNHCVVSQTFLKMNKLQLGDKITMGLGGKLLEQHSGMGAVACVPERYSPPVTKMELEIVGAYIDTDGISDRAAYMYWSYSPNTIFVPLTQLPIEPPKDHRIKPGEFSLVIGDAYHIASFLEKAEPMAKKYGLSLRFNDGGWAQVSKNIKVSTQMLLITTGLFVFASAISILLVVYLFIGQGRKEFAIMRALGTPCEIAKRTFLLRIGVISIIAIPIGAILGLFYTKRAISSALAGIAAAVTKDYLPDTSLPIEVIFICFVGEVVFLSILVTLMLRRLGKMRILTLLQGDTGRKRKTSIFMKQHKIKMSDNISLPEPSVEMVIPRSTGRRYYAVQHVIHYIMRHMWRTGWKTILPIILAVLLPGAMGVFVIMQLSYKDLFDNIEIKSYITNISSDSAILGEDSEMIRDPYYLGGFNVLCNGVMNSMIVTNDLERYAQGEVKVKYAEGYDSLILSRDKTQCVLGSELAEIFGVVPGDEITLLGIERWNILLLNYEGDDLEKQFNQSSVKYTVVAVVSTKDNSVINRSVIAPAGRNTEKVYGGAFTMEFGEFVLADNEMAEEMRMLIETLVTRSLRYSQFATYTMDTTELDNLIRIMNLLEILFPIVVAASVSIGFVAPGLIILQSSKEAAILRILGTSKLRTRCMQALEQIFLYAIGLVIATVGLIVYNQELFLRAAKTLAFCGGLYLLSCTIAALLASVMVTRRRTLELLQTKE